MLMRNPRGRIEQREDAFVPGFGWHPKPYGAAVRSVKSQADVIAAILHGRQACDKQIQARYRPAQRSDADISVCHFRPHHALLHADHSQSSVVSYNANSRELLVSYHSRLPAEKSPNQSSSPVRYSPSRSSCEVLS